ncbi:MAG: 2,3-bisphosphoglycerate-independent phosphoglycerate mutase [Chloroflexi bacterium]|jgi:2,3-bisphosphoglycerate-independent phosphoglycerate mutase|nr:MAG: 2,3-bisphosphoglycerate-independent phosphoglycerate mutase [Chloroflexota bacterium]
MIDFEYLSDIVQPTDSKIVMLVVDGLGGMPHPDHGRSELEEADLPNLDKLASESSCGLTIPVLPGVAPGSGPGHLGLFGYDPVKYLMGRGVLEALGIGLTLGEGEIAARGNLCTVDDQGILTDRRAGRIPTSESTPLAEMLDQIEVDGAQISVYPVEGYRFALVIKGEGLSDNVSETDPQRTGVAPLKSQSIDGDAASKRTAQVINEFVAKAAEILGGRDRANMVMLRGFSLMPELPSFGEQFQLNPAAIAAYPMYRGLASTIGLKIIPTGRTFDEEVQTLREHYEEHNFFYIHYKPADAAGEDGDFLGKARALEALDQSLPPLLELAPDVLVVAGDHSTPAVLAAHSWHPVPVLINSKWTHGTGSRAFSERECATGALGTFYAKHLMFQALAHADKLIKFGP